MEHERNEISLHQVKIFLFLKERNTWVTSFEVVQATGVKYRTVMTHLPRMVQLGILDLAEVFPSHRYRLSDKANKRNFAYMKRLEYACEVFGFSPKPID